MVKWGAGGTTEAWRGGGGFGPLSYIVKKSPVSMTTQFSYDCKFLP